MYIFRAISKYPIELKHLFDIIFQNVLTVNFKIENKGISIEHFTTLNIMIKIFLPMEKFLRYEFNKTEPIYLGLSQQIYKGFFKIIKKKDAVTMYIENDTPFVFHLEKNFDENSRHYFSIPTTDIQNVIPKKNEIYTVSPILIQRVFFSEWFKSFSLSNNFNNQISMIKKNDVLEIILNDGIMIKKFTIGKNTYKDREEILENVFTMEQFSRINKLSSFSKSEIKLFYEKDKPILFSCENQIGFLNLFLYAENKDSN